MKARSLVIPLVFAAAVLFAFFFFDWKQLATPFSDGTGRMPVELSEKFEPLTISFTDPIRGYSVRYPVGYPLQAEDGQSVTFFALGPSGLSETFVFQVVNDSYSAEELETIGTEEFQVKPESVQSLSVSGKKIIRIQYLIPKDQFGEPLYMVQGFVPCGNYSLYFVASIPDSLKDDLDLADYSLYSAQCGAQSLQT